jgi:hypothetical protein
VHCCFSQGPAAALVVPALRTVVQANPICWLRTDARLSHCIVSSISHHLTLTVHKTTTMAAGAAITGAAALSYAAAVYTHAPALSPLSSVPTCHTAGHLFIFKSPQHGTQFARATPANGSGNAKLALSAQRAARCDICTRHTITDRACPSSRSTSTPAAKRPTRCTPDAWYLACLAVTTCELVNIAVGTSTGCTMCEWLKSR